MSDQDEYKEIYRAGKVVWIQAAKPCMLFGVRYQIGEFVGILLSRDWDTSDDIGEGGPWGWGGYTSWALRRLAGNSAARIAG